MPATRRLILIIIVLLLLLLFIVVPGVSWSQTPQNPWQEPARELAKKVVAITGPRQTLALVLRNISALSDSEVAAVRVALEAELRVAGLRLAAEPNSAPELRVTLSENVQGFLWVAELPREDSREVAMVSLPKTSSPAPAAATQMFVLQSKLIYEQDEPILDFVFLDEWDSAKAKRLVVLEPWKLTSLQKVNQNWQVHQSFALPSPKLASRDPRSFLLIRNDAVFAFLPDHACWSAIGLTLALNCWNRDQGAPKPSALEMTPLDMRLVTGKNYFRWGFPIGNDPTLRERLYYDSTSLLVRGESFKLDAMIDGRTVRHTSGSDTVVAIQSEWGSQLRGILSECGKGSQLLATGTGDWTESDLIQAFAYDGTKPVLVSNSINFSGPVTELRAGTPAQTVIAIAHNLKTGRYEAYTLTLSCGR